MSSYIYLKKRQENGDSSKVSPGMSFASYISSNLEKPADYSIRNFQSRRLAGVHAHDISDDVLFDLAATNLKKLGFVGLVEYFRESLKILHSIISPHVRNFEAKYFHENITGDSNNNFADKLLEVETMLGRNLSTALENQNKVDLRIYKMIEEDYFDIRTHDSLFDWEGDQGKALCFFRCKCCFFTTQNTTVIPIIPDLLTSRYIKNLN